MSPRRRKNALELVSSIGALTFDLQQSSPDDIRAAVSLLRTVNPGLFDWLICQLSMTPQDVAEGSHG